MSSGRSSNGEEKGCLERGSKVEIRERRGLTVVVEVMGTGVMER